MAQAQSGIWDKQGVTNEKWNKNKNKIIEILLAVPTNQAHLST
jgi:hypothetical protein